MKKFKTMAVNLKLFEGEGGAESGAENGPVTGDNSGDNNESAAGSDVTTVDLDAEFQELIKGKYKDQYTKSTQAIIDKRFAKAKAAEKAAAETQPLIDLLASRYNVESGNPADIMNAINADDDYWQMVGDQRGMTASQAKQFAELEARDTARKREAAAIESQRMAEEQMNKWYSEADELKKTFPKFDLETELSLPSGNMFTDLLSRGLTMEHAFKVIHFDDIVAYSAGQQEKRVTDNIRAKGARPAENGTSSQGGFKTTSNVHNLSKAERAALAMRAERGERITFS